MIKKYIIIAFFLALLVSAIQPQLAFAGAAGEAESKLKESFSGMFKDATPNSRTLTPARIVAEVLNYVLSFLGILFLGLLIYSGFIWMTAAGDSEKVSKARDILSSAVIGLIIILASYALTWFVLKNLTKATATYY